MSLIRPQVHLQFLDQSGVPYADGTLSLYRAATTVPVEAYKDPEGRTLHTWPIILGPHGEADIFLAEGSYKWILKDRFGQERQTRDNIVVSQGGGGGVTEVYHDETLTGKGTESNPLGADTSVMATRTFVDGRIVTYGIEMRPEGTNTLRFYRPTLWTQETNN